MVVSWGLSAITILSVALTALALPIKPSFTSITSEPHTLPPNNVAHSLQGRDITRLVEIQNAVPTKTEITVTKQILGTSITYTWEDNGQAKTTVGPATFDHPGVTVTLYGTTVVGTSTVIIPDAGDTGPFRSTPP